MCAPSQPHDQPRVDSWSPEDPPDTPGVLLSLEAVGKDLRQEQAGPPFWAQGLLRCRLPVCWGPFLFSSRLARGALGGSGLLYWAGCGSRWKPRGGWDRGWDLSGWWPCSQLQGLHLSCPPEPHSLSSEHPGTLGLCVVGPFYCPTRFFLLWVDLLADWYALILVVFNLYSVGISWYDSRKEQVQIVIMH